MSGYGSNCSELFETVKYAFRISTDMSEIQSKRTNLLPLVPGAILSELFLNICAIIVVARHRSVHLSPRCVLPGVALPSPIGRVHIEKVGLRWGGSLAPVAAY